MPIDEKAEIIAIAKEKCIEYYQKRKEAMRVKEKSDEEVVKACKDYAYRKCYGCYVPECGACFISAVKQAPRIIERQAGELEELRLEKAGFEGAAKQIIEGLKAEVEKYRSVVERDIVIVGRRQGKEAESREIIRYRADLIREAAVKEFAESLLEGRVGNDPVSVAVRVGLKSFFEEEGEK